MKQTVKVEIGFYNQSKTVAIKNVYRKDDILIAVAQIIPTEKVTKTSYVRSDSCSVYTPYEYKLPVKYYVVIPLAERETRQTTKKMSCKIYYYQVNSLADIDEIVGLEPMVLDSPTQSLAQSSFYVRSTHVSPAEWVWNLNEGTELGLTNKEYLDVLDVGFTKLFHP